MPTETLPDGSKVEYDSAGKVTRQVTPDGTVFDRFDGDGRPAHATVPASNGNAATDVDITYQGGQSTWHYPDMTVTRDADGNTVRENLSDGTVFDRFTADGRPTHGTMPGQNGAPPQGVTITYDSGASTWRYDDGTVVSRNGSGDVVREQAADGAVFDQFTPDGKPTHGTMPGQNGAPPQGVTVTYDNGASTWRYDDGTVVSRNGSGDVVREQAADGAVFDQFTPDGKPTHGTMPGQNGASPQGVTVTYDNGASTWRYDDGTVVSRNGSGDVVREQTADGAVFDQFTADGKPTHGTMPGQNGAPPQGVTVTYDNGASTWRYDDGTVVSRNGSGDVVREQAADGAVFDQFTPDGKPTHGTMPGQNGAPPQGVTVTYDNGASTWRYDDGTVVSRNAHGDVTHEKTADGAEFDQFTADGKPTHGTMPGQNGAPPQGVTITYDGGASTWRYDDGTVVNRNPNGDVVREQTADGAAFDQFTPDGKPTHGTMPGQNGAPPQGVTVTYDNGASTWRYDDGTVVDRNEAGVVVREQTADGAVFDQFTADGKPTHGTMPGQNGASPQGVTVTYDNGASTWRYDDGTVVDRNEAGVVVREQTADGAVFDQFTPDGKPTHGTMPGQNGASPQGVTVTYDNGASTWRYDDGTVVDRNAHGDVTHEKTADGAEFDQFTADGKPTHGTMPGQNGAPPQGVTITYDNGASTWRYDDGTVVSRNGSGDVVREQTADGAVFDQFTPDGKPTHGTMPGQNGASPQGVTVTYDNGASTW
ncbi:hypothetical protein, partial [Actinoplanes sp. NPDC049265]|uniref:hypothetical protein n=1 Tax=Actinoplanes sp. NPDC049265 TaxID=3363902 RepID=UPI003723259F